MGQRSDLAWCTASGSAPGPQTRPVQKEGFLGGIRRGQLPWGLRWAKGDRAPWGRPLWGRALGRKRAAPLAPSRRHPSAQSVGRAVTRLRLRSWGGGSPAAFAPRPECHITALQHSRRPPCRPRRRRCCCCSSPRWPPPPGPGARSPGGPPVTFPPRAGTFSCGQRPLA